MMYRMEHGILPSFRSFTVLWLALLTGNIWTQQSVGCPTECTCEPGKVNCEGKNLRSVPSQIPLSSRQLILANNNITHLPSIEMNYFRELVHLDCSRNQLTVDPPFFLTRTVPLIYLDLSFNRIAYISRHTFSQLESLMLLNLSGNPNLTLIEAGAIRGNPMLMYLDISSCGLGHINDHVFGNLSHLHTLGIQNNPWRCDCALLELFTWIEKTTVEFSNIDNIICDEPRAYQGLKLFGTVQQELSFSCFPRLEIHDFLNMVLIAFCTFLGGIFLTVLVGLGSVMYSHPNMMAHDDSDEEEYRMI